MKHKIWDKRWRVVTCEKSHPYFNEITEALTGSGFVKIRDGFYVYPYECSGVLRSILNTKKAKNLVSYHLLKDFNQVCELLFEANRLSGG